jgi:hypothetical protein
MISAVSQRMCVEVQLGWCEVRQRSRNKAKDYDYGVKKKLLGM